VQARFDPYQQWLGIPADEQPPHHYRLLGIRPLESDPDVIRQAARRQAANVRRYQSSQYLAVTNKLLGDIANAASALLDPQAKAAYDAQLRQQLPAAAQAPPWAAGASTRGVAPNPASQAPPPTPGPPPPVAAPPVAGAPGSSAPGAARGDPPVSPPLVRKTPVVGVPAAILFIVAVAALVAVLVMVLDGKGPSVEPGDKTARGPDSGQTSIPPEDAGAADESAGPVETREPDLGPGGGAASEPGDTGSVGTGDSPRDPAGGPGKPAVEPEEPAARTTQRLGNAEVAIVSATIGREPSVGSLTDGGLTLAQPDASSLVVNLELRNLSEAEPLRYLSWAGLWAFDVPVALRDDQGRPYRQRTPLDQSYANQPEAAPNVFVLTEENFRDKVLRAEKPVLVQFYAPWSEPCQSLKRQVDHLSAAYAEKVIVGRFQVADADEPGKYQLTPVLQRYEIRSIPAVIVFNKGRPVAGWIGPPPLSTMEEALDALLPPKPPPHETLGPGRVVHQRLIFEPPADDATGLSLTLPASAVGQEGLFELVIPRAMLAQPENDQAEMKDRSQGP